MPYLRYYDYLSKIQSVNFQQVLSNTDSFRTLTEQEAEEEVISYIDQKYDTDKEFTDTEPWSPSTVYSAKDRVELNFSTYVPATAYVINNLVIYSGNAYICIGATTGTFDPTKWTLLGAQYDLFHVTLPHAEFDYKSYYKVGDQVWWKNKVYTAAISSPILDHETALQYGNTATLPLQNVFPDDTIAGAQYWGTGTTYSVAAGTLPTNTTKWTAGDNRNRLLVQKTVDICLYHLHSRMSPNNIPQLRMDRYAAATAWLEAVADGAFTVNIPRLQPKSGSKIAFGGQVRRQNDY
jgi:hypothetical protein